MIPWKPRLARRKFAFIFLVPFAVISLACGDQPAKPKNGPPPPPPVERQLIDVAMDITHDGKLLAYRHYGTLGQPTGIYVVATHPDSVPRLVMSYNPTADDPSDFRFSPDQSKAAIVRYGFRDIEIVDLTNGASVRVTYTNGNAKSPDWDPSGRFLVYERPFGSYDEPETTAGLFIVDTETLVDRPLLQGVNATFGAWPRWSPDSSLITYDFGAPPHIYAIRPDGTQRADLTPGETRFNRDPLWARDNGSLILFESRSLTTGSDRRTRAISPPSPGASDWGTDIRPFGGRAVIARRAGQFVCARPDSSDRFLVLYLQDLDDISGESRRQVTFPPP